MPRSHFIATLTLFCIFLSASSRVLSQCEIGWSRSVQEDYPGEGIPLAEFDEDGNGPNPPWTIYSGWTPSVGLPLSELAAWNGTYWQAFPGATSSSGAVFAMLAVDADGPGPENQVLWAGGAFTSINGIAAGKVARYDHGSWHGIADGIPAFPFGDIRQFVALDPDGEGPMPPVIHARANSIARLTASGWESLGEGANPPTTVITGLIIADLDGQGFEQPALVRTGRFTPQSPIGEVQKWTGIQWERIGSEFSNSPIDPVFFDPDQTGPLKPELYVGGNYQSIGATTARGIARWRNNEWQPLEVQLVGAPIVSTRLWVGDDDGDGPRPPSLFVSGAFALPDATNSVTRNSARWDGKQWEELGAISEGSRFGIHMNIRGERVFRWFVSAYLNIPSLVREPLGWRAVDYSASYTNLRKLAAIDMDGPGPMDQSVVMVGSGLDPICDGVAKSAASWNGRSWTTLANAHPPGTVNSICMFDFDDVGPAPPQLTFAGRFTLNGLSYATVILQNGAWVPISSSLLTGWAGSSEFANCLTVYDSDGDGQAAPMLILGGTFHSLDHNEDVKYLARWTPQGWAPTSPPLDRAVVGMHVHDDDGNGPIRPAFYVAGPMFVGPIAVNGIAQWDGLNWHPLVDAMTGEIPTINPAQTMCSLQEEPGRFTLCVGGNFFMPQGLVHAARWKNSHWSPMGVTLPSSITRMVALPETNSGSTSNSLYCVASDGINHPRNLYQWDGQEWQNLTNYSSSGSGGIGDMTSIDFDGNGPSLPQLCVYGAFNSIPYGNPVNGTAACIALWGPRQPFYFATPWNRSVAVGERLSLKVATGGPEPMTFAWTRDGMTLTDGGPINGATTRELVINPVAFGDSGQYECIATNGCGSIPSGPTLVRVCSSLANGDLNTDGHIDGLDISPFVSLWTSPASPESDCAVDLTHNGVREPDDIAWFIGRLLSP